MLATQLQSGTGLFTRCADRYSGAFGESAIRLDRVHVDLRPTEFSHPKQSERILGVSPKSKIITYDDQLEVFNKSLKTNQFSYLHKISNDGLIFDIDIII